MRETLESVHPATAAEFLAERSAPEAWSLLGEFDDTRAAELFAALDEESQVELVKQETPEKVAALVAQLPADDRADLVQAMDDEVRYAVLPLVARAERENIRRLASYAEETAGALMTTDYAALPENISVQDALERLRLEAPDKETIYYVYLLDADRRLTGLISLKDLILARPKTRAVGEIAHRDVVAVRVEQDQEEVARTLSAYDFLAIPVVDAEGRLVGIVTFDDAMDVIEEEAAVLWYGNPWLGMIMLLAMVGNLMVAGLFGAAFPLLLKACGKDPALASTIFITTATDVGGFVIFLGLATMFLHYLA